MSAMPQNISEIGLAQFRALVEESDRRPVIVDFWAGWCGPCKILTPILEGLVESYAGDVALAKVDVDAEPELAAQFRIRGLPTVKIFRNGRVVEEFLGVQSESTIRRLVERHLPRRSDRERAEAQRLRSAGSLEEAIARLSAALQDDPENYFLALDLAGLHLEAGEADAAEVLLDALPATVQQDPPAQRLRARAHFVRSATGATTGEADGRYALAARRLLGGEPDAALEDLLGIMRHDRERGQRGLLAAFTLLGSDHELVERYRRRMAALLY